MFRVTLSTKSRVPIYRQIEDQIRYAIASGQLKPGEQLPTVRALAVDLAINPNTVIKAYTELERDDVITSEQGSGTFVCWQPPAQLPVAQRQEKLESMLMEFLAHAAIYGFSGQEVLDAMRSHVGGKS